jgi:hypothetical protein
MGKGKKGKGKKGKKLGSSKAGRPRQEGARTASGRLKPPGPNELMVERRKAMCADITMATDPLDCALANNWITVGDFRTAMTYASLHRAAITGGPGSGGGSGQHEASTGMDATGMTFAQMSSKDITEIWDSAFADTPNPEAKDLAQAEALAKFKAASNAMTAEQRAEVHRVVVTHSWPWWVTNRAAEAALRTKLKDEDRDPTPEEYGRLAKYRISTHERKRDTLLEGLKAIRKGLKTHRDRDKPPPAKIEAVPYRAPSAKVDETTTYVDGEGKVVFTGVRRIAT